MEIVMTWSCSFRSQPRLEEPTLWEVQRESRLIGTEVIDMEHKLFGQVLLTPPHNPSNPCIHKTVFVATHVDALH